MSIHAQKAIVVSGGDISDANFSVSYSIGQVSQEKADGSGLLNQGVQQPFEIFTLPTLGDTDLQTANIKMLVYPNPTVSFVNLSISNLEFKDATYSLFDLQGKLLKSSKINTSKTTVEMSAYPVSTYFLKVKDIDGKILKTFKIIKN